MCDDEVVRSIVDEHFVFMVMIGKREERKKWLGKTGDELKAQGSLHCMSTLPLESKILRVLLYSLNLTAKIPCKYLPRN